MGAEKSKPMSRRGGSNANAGNGGPASRSSTNRGAVDLSQMAARIDRVHIAGLLRTHDDYVQRAVRNCFGATTFQDVLLEVGQARNHLKELGAFKEIHANIEVSKGAGATPNGYEISFETTELSRIVGSVGTEIGNHEGALTVQLQAPNLLGRGESVTLNGSYSNCKSTDLNLKFTKPFLHTALSAYRPQLSASIFKAAGTIPWFRYNTNDLGANLEFSFLLPVAVHHSLQYELALREVGQVGRQVPFHVREHCGPRLASVLRHIGTYDSRDSRIFPTRGLYVQTTNELSGAAGIGDVQYVKNHTHAEINVPLFAGISAQLCGRIGAVLSDKLTDGPVPLSNLFVLGGPLTVRGFHMAGVGEHIEGVPCGAQTFWAAGLHLWSPLPFVGRSGSGLADWFRVHGWTTVGNTGVFSTDGARCSVGAGLAVRIGERARIEFNYCKPLVKGPTDAALKEGFQFGIGVEFL